MAIGKVVTDPPEAIQRCLHCKHKTCVGCDPTNDLRRKGKPIRGTNLETGEVVEYQSTKEAAFDLMCTKECLTNALKGRSKSAQGYVWEYIPQPPKEPQSEKKERNRYSRAVRAYDPVTGELVGEFPSVSEGAKFAGVNFRTVHDVLSGRHKKAGGYCWKYANGGYHAGEET